MQPILILGIGNILLCDEGAGVRAIERMRALALPEGVELLDGGTSGADLVDEIADRRKLIVIDAVNAEAVPGTIFRCTAADLLADSTSSLSLHEFGFLSTLHMARQLGCAPHEVVLFGVQPKEIELRLELSDEVAAALPKLIELVLEEARTTGQRASREEGQGKTIRTEAV